MYSYRHYTPGVNNTKRVKGKYIIDTTFCDCIKKKSDNADLNTNNTQTNSNTSRQIRISQILSRTNPGGRITYGNDTIRNINYLGMTEGQPGGSLQPIKNRF